MGIAEVLVSGGIAALFASIAGGGVKIGEFEIKKFASQTTRLYFLFAAIALVIAGIFSSAMTDAVERVLSLQERREWKAAESDDNCSLFEEIARRKGKFAAAAEERLSEAKFKSAVEKLSFPVTVPWTDPPARSEPAARQKLATDAKRVAEDFCSQNAQLYNGERATGIFTSRSSATCEQANRGYICTASGFATCTYVVPNKIKVCPSQ